MTRFDALLARFVRSLCLIGGWTLLTLALAIAVSSLLRKFFSVSIQGIDEIGGYVLAIVASIGFSLTLLERAHIRIEIVRATLPRRGQAWLDLLALFSMLFTALALVALAIGVTRQSVDMGAVAMTTLRTPLVYPQSLWSAALGLFAAITCYLSARCMIAAVRRDWDGIRQRVGSQDIAEEVARELSEAQARTAALATEPAAR